MHILYIHQYFGTPETTGGTRSYEFARRWISQGHKVTMLTSSSHLGPYLKDAKGFLFKKFEYNGINVVSIDVHYSQHMTSLRRIWSFFLFMILSSVYGVFAKKANIVYATSTPLTIGVPALVWKAIRRKPYVFEVRDQWPKIPIELGIIRNGLVIKLLLWLERTIYLHSGAIVALSPGMLEGIKEVLAGVNKKIELISNCCDIELISPDIDGDSFRSKYGWSGKQVFLHAGAIGKVNGLGFLVEVADRVKNVKDIHFVIIGFGREKKLLEKRVADMGLTNIEFLGFVPKVNVPEYYAASDISTVIISEYPVLEHNSANKFFDSLSAGKPILLNYSGWQRDVLEQNKAGFGCKLCDLNEFVDNVLYLNSHREVLVEMGKNSRHLAEKEFNRNDLAAKALSLLLSVSEKN